MKWGVFSLSQIPDLSRVPVAFEEDFLFFQRAEAVGYDTVWSYKGRPNWITTARSYELVDASSRSLVEVLAERRARLREQAADGA